MTWNEAKSSGDPEKHTLIKEETQDRTAVPDSWEKRVSRIMASIDPGMRKSHGVWLLNSHW